MLASAMDVESISSNLRDGLPCPYTLADAERYIASQISQPPGPQEVYPRSVTILVKPACPGNQDGSHPLIIGGLTTFPTTNVNFRTWEFGYWLTPAVHRNGYGLEVILAFVRWAFETWSDLNRFEAAVYRSNVASLALLSKAGFKQEGVKRESVFKGGELKDEVIMGLVRADLLDNNNLR